jgi:hypothetical protein
VRAGEREEAVHVRIAIIAVSVDVCFGVYDDAILRTRYQNIETLTRCGPSVNAPLGLPVIISSDQMHNGKCAYTLYGRPQPLTNKVGRELLSDINAYSGQFLETIAPFKINSSAGGSSFAPMLFSGCVPCSAPQQIV